VIYDVRVDEARAVFSACLAGKRFGDTDVFRSAIEQFTIRQYRRKLQAVSPKSDRSVYVSAMP